jgi:hypothetical protein
VTGPTSVGARWPAGFGRRGLDDEAGARHRHRRTHGENGLFAGCDHGTGKLPSSNGGVGSGPGDVGLGRVSLVWRRHGSRSVGVVETLLRVLLAAYLVAEVNETL